MKQYTITLEGKEYKVQVKSIQRPVVVVEVNGKEYIVNVESHSAVVPEPLQVKPVQKNTPPPPAPSFSRVSGDANEVRSPLPGVILDIKVQPGEEVKAGQTLVILEAMKMENEIKAHRDGKIVEIPVKKGDNVLEGAVLARIGG